MKEKINELLIEFFEKHKDDLPYDDVVNFNNLWARIHNEVEEDDNLWNKGGDHYKDFKIQPSQFINKNELPFAEGNVIKYICRHASKGKKEDILKAIHYCEMIIERDYE
jgi:hypothetical protein